MSISSTTAYNPSFNTSVNPSITSALSNTLDTASALTQFASTLLQNLLQARQQQNGGIPGTTPSVGGTPGTTPSVGGTPGTTGTQGLGQNGLGGLMQSLMELMQALQPLMQALGNSTGGANPMANNVANQLGGGGQTSFGQAYGVGNPTQPFPSQPAYQSFAQNQGVGTFYQPTQSAGYPQTFQPVYQTQQVPTMPYDSFSVNAPAMLGVNNQTSALQWAQMYGGANQTQADLQQGMNLYSIFNTGSRMF